MWSGSTSTWYKVALRLPSRHFCPRTLKISMSARTSSTTLTADTPTLSAGEPIKLVTTTADLPASSNHVEPIHHLAATANMEEEKSKWKQGLGILRKLIGVKELW
jgi:hypothetical protein